MGNLWIKQQELEDIQKKIVMDLLVTKYKFFYEQLILEAEEPLRQRVEGILEGELEDLANDNIHIERFSSGHHAEASTSISAEEMLELVAGYNDALALIDKMYNKEKDK